MKKKKKKKKEEMQKKAANKNRSLRAERSYQTRRKMKDFKC